MYGLVKQHLRKWNMGGRLQESHSKYGKEWRSSGWGDAGVHIYGGNGTDLKEMNHLEYKQNFPTATALQLAIIFPKEGIQVPSLGTFKIELDKARTHMHSME